MSSRRQSAQLSDRRGSDVGSINPTWRDHDDTQGIGFAAVGGYRYVREYVKSVRQMGNELICPVRNVGSGCARGSPHSGIRLKSANVLTFVDLCPYGVYARCVLRF